MDGGKDHYYRVSSGPPSCFATFLDLDELLHRLSIAYTEFILYFLASAALRR